MATQDDQQGKVLTRTKTKKKLKRPRMYKVLLHNDDFTPREFVVLLLQHIFQRGEADAMRIMLYVHNNGVGVVGVYTFAVSETKVAEVLAAAEHANYPLIASMEPESDGDEEGSDDGPPN